MQVYMEKKNRKFAKILLYKSPIIGGRSSTPSPKPLHMLRYNLLKHLGQWHDFFVKLCNLKTGLIICSARSVLKLHKNK